MIAAMSLVLGVLLLLVHGSPGPVRSARRGSRSAQGAAGPLEVARLVERLATVVAAGVAPRPAWTAVAGTIEPGPLQDLASSVGAGADPRRAATGSLTGRGEVTALGTALALCERTGAPTARLLTVLASALRDVQDAEQARRSAFAGPRTTGRILLCLPVAGLGLGILLGADPLGMLLGSPAGRLLLMTGALLTVGGWWWMRLLLRSAGPSAPDRVDPSILLELVAGPLAAGAPLASALMHVSAALDGEEPASWLDRAGRSLSAGAGAAVALADCPPQLAALRDAALVSEETGAQVAGLLHAAARDARQGRAREAEAAAARMGVRLVLPTGAALLPAFVVLGIVPTAASLLGGSLTQVMP